MRICPCRTRAGFLWCVVLATIHGHPVWAQELLGPEGALADLMTATGLKHRLQNEATAVVLMRGATEVQVVTVRFLDPLIATFTEILAVPEATVPAALWRKATQVNARPSLAHVGYSRAKQRFYALSALPDVRQATGPLLRTMIIQTALLADELRPSFRDLLEASAP